MNAMRWIGMAVLVLVVACMPAWADDAVEAAPAEAPAAPGAPAAVATTVGWIELKGSLREGPPPFAWVTEAEAGPSLQSVLRQLRFVTNSKSYLGVVIYLDYPDLDLPQVQAIADAMVAVRDAGKKVFVFSEVYDLRTYLLACNADQILLQRKGEVMLHGLGVEEMYLAGLLEKVGMKADFVQVGRFKGAEDPLTRKQPSEAWNQNMDALLDDMYASIIDRIAAGRKLTKEQVEAVIQDCWTMTDEEYVKRRVVDRVCDRDMIEVTEIEFGDAFTWDEDMGMSPKTASNTNAFTFFQTLFQASAPKPRRDSIAIIHARGPISSGDSSFGDGLFSGDSIGSRTMCEALSDAADDNRIKGVVVRIDSPGGSAIASEVIWQSVRQVAQSKPVYVSIGGMAASGGYYIASAADEIYVAPDSIVGSIGVVGGKLIAGGLYEMIGVGIHRRSRGPHGDLFNSVEPFTEPQRKMLQLSFEKVYAQFTDRVATGRGKRLADVAAVAEGRLFTGRQAAANGMADKVGGLGEAVRDLAQRLGLQPGRYDVINLPPPMSLPEFLDSIFNAQAPVTASPLSSLEPLARQALGDRRWHAARAVLVGLMQLQNEPVLTLMPNAIVVR